MGAIRFASGSFSKSVSLQINSAASARPSCGIPGQGMSSTSLGSSLFNPPP
jgi:hypothetical protein